MKAPSRPLSSAEFIALLAFMVSIVAMASDVMLPALAIIGADLGISDANNTQLIVSSLFLGLAIGQFFSGALSDSFGRRTVILWGYAIFLVGCLLSIFATDLTIMLLGRVLQGLGAAAPRDVGVSIVRDRYEGRAMARVMSVIMSIFILVPALAPGIGQGVLYVLPWPYTFVVLLLMGATAALWFGLRQPGTLAAENRRRFSLPNMLASYRQLLRIRAVLGYIIVMGFIFGPFIAYLGMARQIFQDTLGVGELFAVYFGIASLAIGAASVCNSLLVMRLGMRLLCRIALYANVGLSGVFLWIFWREGGVPPIQLFLIWQLSVFFCMGILFGNLNALAMEPLGKMAGLGAALIGFISSIMSLPIAWLIGQLYDGTVLSLVGGFFVLGVCALIAAWWTERSSPSATRTS